MDTINSIQKAIDHGQNKYRYTLELKDKVILNTTDEGVKKILENSENMRNEFDKLINDIQRVRQNVTNQLNDFNSLKNSSKLFKEYLNECEQKVDSNDFSKLTDINEKKSQLEFLKIIRKELELFYDLAVKLQVQCNDKHIFEDFKDDLNDDLNRYFDLKSDNDKKIEDLQNEVNNFEDYRMKVKIVIDWLNMIENDIKRNFDTHGELNDIILRKKNLTVIENQFDFGQNLIDSLSQYVDNNEIENIYLIWNRTKHFYNQVEFDLQKCIDNWNTFLNNLNTFRISLSKIHDDVKTIDSLEDCKKIIDQLILKKDEINDELIDRCENLIELSASNFIREQCIEILVEHGNLMNEIRILETKFLKDFHYLNDFRETKEKILILINQLRLQLNCNIEINSELQIIEQVKSFNEFFEMKSSEGHNLINNLQLLLSFLNDDYNQDFHNIQNDWLQLQKDLKNHQNRLKNLQNNFNEMNRLKSDFREFLDKYLKSNYTNEFSDSKSTLNRLKNCYTDLDKKYQQIDLLNEFIGYNLITVTEVNALRSDYENVLKSLNEDILNIENEIENSIKYQQLLQSIEKWLLQTSFQLMVHNSLFITDQVQIFEQIEQNNVLLNAIENYQSNIDLLQKLGRDQNSIRVVDIEKQLQHVSDSYQSLYQTALQIKTRLHDCLEKFQTYQHILNTIFDKLDDFEVIKFCLRIVKIRYLSKNYKFESLFQLFFRAYNRMKNQIVPVNRLWENLFLILVTVT